MQLPIPKSRITPTWYWLPSVRPTISGYLLQVMPSSISPWLWMTAPLDGVIHSEPRENDPVREILLQRGIPMVSVGRPLKAGRLDSWVDTDHTVAIELLMQRFRDAGAHRVGYLMPDHDDAYPEQVLDALLGWCERAEIETVCREVRAG